MPVKLCTVHIPMASLHKLLSQDGFQRQKTNKKVKFKHTTNTNQETITLPIYICHDRRSLDRVEKSFSFKGSSFSETSKTKSSTPRRDEPAIDDVAIKAMVSILSGYIGRYLKHKSFRQSIREKCFEQRKNEFSFNDSLANMEMGIESIERLVETRDFKKEMDLESLQKSIKILNIVAALDSSNSTSACAHLYLSIVYKIAKNDKISARHLLQVFSDAPFLARTHLLPEFWELFFLPHLLHLKIWYNKELDFLASSSDYGDDEKRIKILNKHYNEQMDNGTVKFAEYYKEWLKIGCEAPSVPCVPLPSKSFNAHSRRKSADSSTSYQAMMSNKSLYQAVFGPTVKGRSMELDNGNGALKNVWDLEVQENVYSADQDHKNCNHVEKKVVAHRRHSSQVYRTQKTDPLWHDGQKSDYLRFLGCRSEPRECMVQRSYISNNDKTKNDVFQLDDMARAIATICSSESLSDCEMAVRAVSEAWLNSNGDRIVEISLSQASVILGIMEVLSVSSDDEILELGISILAELATKNETNRQCILNSDPQLSVSIRLMRSSSLFLKAAALLYLVKPKAKQMVSTEWIPLVLRVLEFGDQSQTLFNVRCMPHEAAYYFLNELITGFDEDKNLENTKQIISLGGLSLLVRRMDVGDVREKSKGVSVLYHCVRADGSCRHYLAKNLKKGTVISLLVLRKQTDPQGHAYALALLTELLLLNRRNQRVEALIGLTKGWDCLNTLHILLSYLQRARPEERPVIAVLLLQLDLMGDPLEYSIYREEAIDAIVKALDSCVFDEKIQEASARALLILGGQFSYTGEPEIERWLLRKAGLDKDGKIPFRRHQILNEEDKIAENWQRKAAIALLSSGNRRLLAALSDSISNSIPRLARASLVTVCWMSHFIGDGDLRVAACSILVPQLIEYLNDNNNLDEKILASFSVYSLTKDTDYFSRSPVEKEVLGWLGKLTRATWTAKELVSIITNCSSNSFS